MGYLTAAHGMTDTGGTDKKRKNLWTQQQSSVQTPDLVNAKSDQKSWNKNLERVQQKAEVRKDAWALEEKKQAQSVWNRALKEGTSFKV